MATRAMKIHELLAAHHQFAATEHAKVAESLGKDAPTSEFHRSMSEHHAQMAEASLAECDAANKAAADEVAKASIVAPTVPANIRAVPRYGQRGFERTEVPVEFAKFVTRVSEED